jgi:hypothetical protein
MGLLSEFTQYKHLNFAKEKAEPSSPRTAPTTMEDANISSRRIPRVNLESLYRNDAQTFNTINTYKQILLQSGYRIDAENKTNQKQYDKFFEDMGIIGMKVKLNQLLDGIIQDTCLYGLGYVELVDNVKGDRIVDLKPVDSKLMDYVRDYNGIIMTDSEQNPIGYTMDVGYGSNSRGDQWPRGSRQDPNKIFLEARRIACFVLFPYGNRFEGMGLVEPAYSAITKKIKIESAAANSIHNSAAYPIYAVLGDSQKTASKQLMESTLNTLKNLSSNRYMVFPYPTQLNALQVEHSPQVDEMLRYLRTEQSAASGLALGFTVGSGETINRSTLNTQKEMLDVRLDSIADSLAEQFTTKILDKLYEKNNYGSKAKMIWNNISTEDKFDKSKILLDCAEKKAITPRELRKFVNQIFGVELDEEDFNKFVKKEEENIKKQLENNKISQQNNENNIENQKLENNKNTKIKPLKSGKDI